MARDGSGTYSLPEAAFTGGTAIESAKANNNNSDMAAALTGSIAKDGQTNPTADLPMNAKKHTGVANASARDEYPSAGEITDGSLTWAGVAGGTADALTVTLAPALTALVIGLRIYFKAGAANNTGAATIAINGLSTVSLESNDSPLEPDDIEANKYYEGLYDGTAVQLSRIGAASVSLPLPVDHGGTGGVTAAEARTNLGLVIGTDVQAELAVPSQAEAEAGTATDERVWTALRVAQAIAALETDVGITLGTEQAATSGTEIDFAVPAGVKRITIMLVGVSTSGTSDLIVQLGDSGGVEASGYSGTYRTFNASATGAAGASSTAGATVLTSGAASKTYRARIELSLEDSANNTWLVASQLAASDHFTTDAICEKSLTALLDRVRITTVGGSDTFDAGAINISYES